MIDTPPIKPPTQAAVVDSLESTFTTLTEREILMELYEVTNGDNWCSRENWCSGDPLSEWTGVCVDELGKVDRLNLWSNGLKGVIPKSLGNLNNLIYLDFDNNELEGKIPLEFSNLKNLELLYLHRNKLTGEIPKSLGNMEKLRFIRLDYNQLSGEIPEELSNLNLEEFCIQHNDLSGELPDFVKNIDQTCLGFNKFTN